MRAKLYVEGPLRSPSPVTKYRILRLVNRVSIEIQRDGQKTEVRVGDKITEVELRDIGLGSDLDFSITPEKK